MTGSGALAAPVGEVVVLSAGALGAVASLLPWYEGSGSALSGTPTLEMNAWTAGASAWLSILGLESAAVVVLVSGATASRRASPRCWPLAAGFSTFSLVCLIAWWASWRINRDDGHGYSAVESHDGGLTKTREAVGLEVGFYLAMLAITVATVATVLKLRYRSAP